MDTLKSIKLWLSKHLAPQKTIYPLIYEPIDVVIPCVEKDLETLEECTLAIRNFGQDIRRIIVVSQDKFTDHAEWFPENKYPFSKMHLSLEIFKNQQDEALNYLVNKKTRIGWIYQQLLKLYAPLVIPQISSNVLIMDSDVIFLKETAFMSKNAEPLFNVGKEWHKPYFEHAKRLLPFLTRVYPKYSGVCHHMLFQRAIVKDLFAFIRKFHEVEPWRAICQMIDHKELFGSAISEYEIYFNFAFSRTSQAHIRPLKWVDLGFMDNREKLTHEGYHYMACQSWKRSRNISKIETYV